MKISFLNNIIQLIKALGGNIIISLLRGGGGQLKEKTAKNRLEKSIEKLCFR